MSRRLLVPLIALVVTIGGLLGCAAWNRGEVRQRLTLTERELNLPWQWQNSTANDDAALRLPIGWERREGPLEERNWLTEDKLREIGFNLSTPAGAPEADRAYRRALPRIGWVVLEYDGPAWRDFDRRRQLFANVPEPRLPLEPSRLMAIDAGADRDALARRHADAPTLILPAIFQLAFLPPNAPGGPLVYGYLQRLVVNEVSVPRRLRSALADLRTPLRVPEVSRPSPAPPRFEVDLTVGRSGLPWITDVRRIPR
jgi:hypothetical protein